MTTCVSEVREEWRARLCPYHPTLRSIIDYAIVDAKHGLPEDLRLNGGVRGVEGFIRPMFWLVCNDWIGYGGAAPGAVAAGLAHENERLAVRHRTWRYVVGTYLLGGESLYVDPRRIVFVVRASTLRDYQRLGIVV